MTFLLLALTVFLVVLNGFFVAAEFSLVKARSSHLEGQAEAGVRGSKRALEEIRQIDSYLSACQLGITMASIGLGFAGEPALGGLFEPLFADLFGESASVASSITLAFIIITAMHIVIGELAPKSVAIAHAEGTIRIIAEPLHLFRRLFTPAIAVLNGTANWLVSRVGIKPISEMEMGASGEDLRLIIAQASNKRTLDAGEAFMLSGVFDLHEQEARQVMTPIPAVVTVDIANTAEVALRRCVSSGHTRMLVTEDENPDRIKGIIHSNSLARVYMNDGGDASIERIVKPVLIVPETKPLDDLLADLQRERTSMAVIADEYGRTAGIVTVEDIIEEVVGEIDDETDPTSSAIRQLSNGDWFVRGHVALGDLEDHGLILPIDSETYNSIGGFVFGELGRLPKRGDSVRANGHMIRVESVRENRIESVRIRVLDAPD